MLGLSALVWGAGGLRAMAAAPCFPPAAFQKSQCLKEERTLKPRFSPLRWQQPFLGEFTPPPAPPQCCPFPQESCLQPQGSAACSFASL